MEPSNVIDAVLAGQAKPGWAIFKYSAKETVKSIIANATYTLLFIIPGGILILGGKTGGAYLYAMGGIFELFGFYFLISFIKLVHSLFYAKRNMIVFTDKEALKSFNGDVSSYPYEFISSLRITNPMAANMPAFARNKDQYVDFTDTRTNKVIELTHNRMFGPPEPIFNFLNSKLIQ